MSTPPTLPAPGCIELAKRRFTRRKAAVRLGHQVLYLDRCPNPRRGRPTSPTRRKSVPPARSPPANGAGSNAPDRLSSNLSAGRSPITPNGFSMVGRHAKPFQRVQFMSCRLLARGTTWKPGKQKVSATAGEEKWSTPEGELPRWPSRKIACDLSPARHARLPIYSQTAVAVKGLSDSPVVPYCHQPESSIQPGCLPRVSPQTKSGSGQLPCDPGYALGRDLLSLWSLS